MPLKRAHDTAWQEHGAGSPVVFIHGLGMDQHMWAGQVHALADRYRVITYDLIGHGESVKRAGPYSLAMFDEQLQVLADACGIERFALIGFSLGGLIAQTFALAHPQRLHALVIMNAVYDRNAEERAAVLARAHAIAESGPAATIDTALERWLTPGFRRARPDVETAVRRRVMTNDPACYAAAYRVFAEADAELAGRLHAIRCPALVITGENDSGSHPAMAKRMADAIPGAELTILPESRHLAPMEDPDTMNAALLDFLERASKATRPR
ncbi:MAG: alpha/beta fold hydrolase [Alphaproteobacteria bacterium]